MLSSLLFHILLVVLASAIRQEKEMEILLVGKADIKLCLLANGTIIYRENLKAFTKELLKLMMNLRKI